MTSDPQQSPPSPTASYFDMSDDEEGEYNTIKHSSSGKGVKLLFTKSKVYVHPTPSSKDNIPGFVALVQQKSPIVATERPGSSSSKTVHSSSLLLAWIPETGLGDAYDTYVKVDLSDSSSPPKQSYLVPPLPTTSDASNHGIGTYAFAVPVSEIFSLLVRPPSIGWWFGSVVINTRAGNSFPALFFHDSECQSTIMQRKRLARESFDPFDNSGSMFWGGDEVLRWLKRYVNVVRSTAEPNAYLVEPSEEDKLSFTSPVTSPKEDNTKQLGDGKRGAETKPAPKNGDASMDPLTKTLKQARWNFLEKFSQVTTFTRRTAAQVAENPKIPPQIRRLIANPEVQTIQEEFDSARIYLARWAMGIAEQSERERNQRIWHAKDVLETEEGELGEFELLDVELGGMSLEDRQKPVTMEEWKGWFDDAGRLLITADEVRERVFHGGLDKDDGVRKEAWLFLLGVYDWDSSKEERHTSMNSRRDEYIRLKGAWWERMVDEHGTLEEREWWREQRARIEKDVHRTDRNIPLFAGEDLPHPDPNSPFADVGTNVHLEQMKDMLLTYNEYNKSLGYVQGMSDLLAPLYAVLQDDALAFWAFVGFMSRMERNFLRDQSGMREQLLTLDQLVQLLDPKLYLHLEKAESTNFFFFFRMLLVWYKREFGWFDVLRLWEGLWTDHLSANYHLFIAVAILEKHRDVIMNHLRHFDEVLKYVNELSGSIDLNSTLARAEALFRRFRRTVEAIDRKTNFPVPSTVRQRKSLGGVPEKASAPATSAEAQSSSDALKKAQRHSANGTTSQTKSSAGAASAVANGKQPEGASETEGVEDEKEKIITPQLRKLLSRKVEKLERQEIERHGGGIGS